MERIRRICGTLLQLRKDFMVAGYTSDLRSFGFHKIACALVCGAALALVACSESTSLNSVVQEPLAASTASSPGAVDDLTAIHVTSGSITLSWSQVGDGTGEPAKFDARYAFSPIGWGWGDATVVTEGTCATPVEGTAIDSTLTCTVLGLKASTTYDFQVVAYRGVLNESSVFGALSNVATATTAEPEIGRAHV